MFYNILLCLAFNSMVFNTHPFFFPSTINPLYREIKRLVKPDSPSTEMQQNDSLSNNYSLANFDYPRIM